MRMMQLLGLTMLALMLQGCPTIPTTTDSVACQAFRKIKMSHEDTKDTQVQVKEHNAVYRELCEPK